MADRSVTLPAMAAGIVKVHRKGCTGGRCRCSSFEAWVWDAHAGRKIRKTFGSEQAARNWRVDTQAKGRRARSGQGRG